MTIWSNCRLSVFSYVHRGHLHGRHAAIMRIPPVMISPPRNYTLSCLVGLLRDVGQIELQFEHLFIKGGFCWACCNRTFNILLHPSCTVFWFLCSAALTDFTRGQTYLGYLLWWSSCVPLWHVYVSISLFISFSACSCITLQCIICQTLLHCRINIEKK